MVSRFAPLLFAPALALVLGGCSPLDTGPALIIGHGGAGSEGQHPMNSEEAMDEGLASGIDGVELDVQFTADDVLVAYHPALLDELTPCKGKVNATQWDELRRCSNTAEGDRAYRIVRLDSLLPVLAMKYPGSEFTLDIKLFAEGEWLPYLDRFSTAIQAMHEHPELAGRMIVECQNDEFLEILRDKAPTLPLYLYATDATSGMNRAAALGCAGITMDNDRMSKGEVADARAKRLKVTLFGTRSWWEHRDALSKKPDRIQTDAPAQLVQD